MLYAISDVHGCLEDLKKQMEQVDLTGGNKIVLLGDYIDFGDSSLQVLKYLWNLQNEHGKDRVIALKGNHEAMFLNWIDEYKDIFSDGTNYMAFNDWLVTDFECGASTIRTFLSDDQMRYIQQISRSSSMERINKEVVQMILSNHTDLIEWLRKMPVFYETEDQIFVHAGIDEEAGENCLFGTSEDILLWKYPATKGKFHKTIVAGHIGTASKCLANNQNYHDVYYDGESHYYIDGSVYKCGGKLLLLCYDEREDKYYQIESGRKREIRKYENE
jgi:serine/threonine protein phosphatase 1